MATTNVVVSRTGTAWTVDVTACNLTTDTTVKDFIVLINSALANNADFAKTTPTTLTYNGAAVPAASTVEVRRKTPTSVIKVIDYGVRFSSADYNNELDRIVRRAEEYELNGVGAGSILTVATPLDTAFGASWDGNIVNPPTMNAAYDYLIQLAKIASPVFTGDPQAPTPATADNDTSIATTAYVKNNLASYAPLASPTFTGTPAAPTAAVRNNSTTLANTAFVQAAQDDSLRVAQAVTNTAQAWTAGVAVLMVLPAPTLDRDSAVSTPNYTPPTTGYYRISGAVSLSSGAAITFANYQLMTGGLAGTVVANLAQTSHNATFAATLSFSTVLRLTGGTSYQFRFLANSAANGTVTQLTYTIEWVST